MKKELEQLIKEHRILVQQIVHLQAKEENIAGEIRRIRRDIRRKQGSMRICSTDGR